MTMLLKPLAIAKMAKMAMLAILAIFAMDNDNFCMGIRGIQLKSTKN